MTTITTFLRIRESLREADCRTEQVRWIRVRGDLTPPDAIVDTADRLRSAGSDARRLIVDATGVDEVDTKFIAVLVDLHRRARSHGAELVIVPSAAVRRWLRICRLEILLR